MDAWAGIFKVIVLLTGDGLLLDVLGVWLVDLRHDAFHALRHGCFCSSSVYGIERKYGRRAEGGEGR